MTTIVQHGHCSPPEGELAKWARCQRGKDATLTEERKHRLNALGYVWEPHKTKWDGMFQKMLEYKEEFGDCDVPKVCISYSTNIVLPI